MRQKLGIRVLAFSRGVLNLVVEIARRHKSNGYLIVVVGMRSVLGYTAVGESNDCRCVGSDSRYKQL